MFREFLSRIHDRVFPDASVRQAEIEALRADVRELERSLRDLKKELRESRVAAPAPSLQTPLDTTCAEPAAVASGDRVVVDEKDCIGCGTCVEIAESVFSMTNGGRASVLTQDAPRDLVQKAIDACPVTCIRWS